MRPFNKVITHLLVASLVYSPSILASPFTTLPEYGPQSLPEIGTAAAATLSVKKEMEYGDAYMRLLRASRPLVYDPLLSEYIHTLGTKLLSKAQDVKTPFSFFLVQDKSINAFAFFGGHIGIHTGLFFHAQTQGELASVLAHEIAHLTQRHLARAMEAQAKQSPLAMAALIGSIMLSIAAPQAGIAAIQATAAANMQSQINYTRSNEQEADRIGINILSRAGFDTYGMHRFFERMATEFRFTTTPPPFLLTHPLPTSRITEARTRAQQYPKKTDLYSLNYALARSRVIARYSYLGPTKGLNWFNVELKTALPNEVAALNYGKALIYLDNQQFEKAEKILNPLLKKDPQNLYYLDAYTDLDLNQNKFKTAILRLKKALEMKPNNAVLSLNLNYALIKEGKFKEAINNLHRFTHQNPSDINGWSMLQEAYDKDKNRHGALMAQGEIFALQAHWKKAISNYVQASHLVPLGSLDQARYDARIDQLTHDEIRFRELQN